MMEKFRAVAVVECFEEIPCDPCRTGCPVGAISFAGGISSLPQVSQEICTGCGLCVARCPGQAIFLVGRAQDGSGGSVTVPYEFLPLPQVEEEVELLDRQGQPVGTGRVDKVQAPPSFDGTAVVTLRVPAGDCDRVRGFRTRKGDGR